MLLSEKLFRFMAIINITAYFTEILVFLISSKLFKVGLFRKASEIKITHLASSLGVDEKSLDVGTRKLITVANGPGLSELMRESGVGVIDAFNSRRVLAQEWIDATENARSNHD